MSLPMYMGMAFTGITSCRNRSRPWHTGPTFTAFCQLSYTAIRLVLSPPVLASIKRSAVPMPHWGRAAASPDTITAGWNTVAYRVRSYDSYNATSTYVTSETRTVDNNAIPVITSSTTSGTDLGTKEDGFDLTYTVTDADSDTVTVKEYLDNVLKRTYTATLGQSNTVQCVTAANWQKVLNGAHTIKVVANDTKADSAPYTVTFTKAVYEASITLAEPMDADDAITVMVLNVLGSIPADADLEVLVTNNANDTEPVWEDATQDVKNGNNHVFTNQTAANGFAFNFKVNVGRGTSNTGGYITSIGGARSWQLRKRPPASKRCMRPSSTHSSSGTPPPSPLWCWRRPGPLTP